ncbi:hypothetical protein [Lysinibacillus sp. LK3]|uniref:hypothetical protein n=1 Tax=Lysinibacillus sp. LK3 TaxID=1628207 RepID=UPI000652C959|nr:hypothetical protein [Lysinibacillus sp. LK3]KMN41288.1 hypothetical protein VK91_03880 [Lysinibacillus sp. LK3]
MISADFKKAVQIEDEEKVKMMLKNSLTMDLTFNQFKSMLEYTLKFIPNIIESHDGTKFESKENWDKDYASLLKYDLVDNFSAERIQHIKEVQQYVYADELKKQQQSQCNTSQQQVQQPKLSSQNSNNRLNQSDESSADSQQVITLIAVLGVGVASILLGVLKGWSIVTIAATAVIATVVVGGITYYVVKK